MADDNIYIGRQPILDTRQSIYAYELLFRTGQANSAKVVDSLSASARVVSNTLNNIGIQNLLAGKTGFLNIDHIFLEKEMYQSIPKKGFVLEILENTIISSELIKQVTALRDDGYVFALDDFVFKDSMIEYFRPLFPLISYVKIDLKENSRDLVQNKMRLFRPFKVKMLAEKVETMDEFDFYKGLGFDYFQGYFFEKPTIIKGHKIDPAKYSVIEILQQLQKDQDIQLIENTLKKYPDLTINLLRFINSAAIATRSKINSVRQAIALLGYRKLMSWLLLLAYASGGESPSDNPLFSTAVQRAKSMELLLKTTNKTSDQAALDEAFLTGLLSLLDALFQKPLDEIVQELNLGKEITDAILYRNNTLGQILNLVETAEKDKLHESGDLMNKLGVTVSDLGECCNKSFEWLKNMA